MLQRKLSDDVPFASRFYHALAILSSDRLRATETRMACGQEQDLEDESVRLKDELDLGVLDHVSMASDRFDCLLKRVAASAQSKVTKVVLARGFRELARFAVQYPRMFNDSPSAILCQPKRDQINRKARHYGGTARISCT